jgi:cellulose synthase/poly-beta-1,6-N-acetylglucosamine synthase-like glycosyltransferase
VKADGQTANRWQGEHKEGYRTLRGDILSEAGDVVVRDPWEKIGEIRLPADRQPFVSVQLALYNESEVVDRLLTACTSFDYENYEVLVVDDSTDDTVKKLERWRRHPRVRVIHRASRKGFKGGALQEALKRMHPRTEYVMIFDADFVPPADAIWHFLDYFGRLAKAKSATPNEHASAHGAPQNGDRLAVVQGYQWHMLNASENWITKGVRAEFSGSYVLERAGQELFGAMKMISGSVYMIRADVLRKLGWSTSITEDWELTIRLYLAGYKVLYTPYIQAPAECVSTVSRLIKQRMRWAEGHTYNVRKYFWQILRSPNLSWQEKLEFVYYAPYYLQSVLFGIATVAWIVGVLIMGQKLPMWGEIFGWSLVVSNALALPLMNLTGVLLEGSLRRDALGLLSFVGLSWILAPFQAYASAKALFERKEGGWVRTPKSGVVTEALERFHLARLMPWEMPKRRNLNRKGSRAAHVAAAALAVFIAAGILTIGALSLRAVAATGTASDADFAIPAVVGTAIPLAILALGWLRVRRRMTAVLLAFTLGLGTNVVFLAHAVPAAAVTDNSSVFTLQSTPPATAFGYGYHNLTQNYTPTSPTATRCSTVTTATFNKTCSFLSDSFSTGQSISGGATAQADLYLENTNTVTYIGSTSVFIQNTNVCTLNKPAGIHDNDVLLVVCAFRGGTGITVTAPDATWTALTRIDNGTTLSITSYWHVVASAASEPASFTFSLSGNAKGGGALLAYAGVDTAAPIGQETGQTTPSGTSHTALSVTTSVANSMLVTMHAVSALNGTLTGQWTPPPGMTELIDTGSNTGSAASNSVLEVNHLFVAASGTATGAQTATSQASAVGATKTITLKPPTTARTCPVSASLKWHKPIQLRSSTTNYANDSTSITLSKPTGTQENDLLVMIIGTVPAGGTIVIPSGFTTIAWTSGVFSYYHVVGASDPGPWTWGLVSTPQPAIVGWLGAYMNVDTTSPVDPTHPTSTSGNNATLHAIASSGMSTAGTNRLLIAAFDLAAATTWAPPADMFEVVELQNVGGSSTATLAIDHQFYAQAGTVDRKTATSSVAGSGYNLIFALVPVAANTSVLGTTTLNIASPAAPTLVSNTFSLSGVTFTSGDYLLLDVAIPDDPANCPAVRVSFDSTGQPSKLTIASIVPEGVVGLLLLAPGLPIAARWWKRRRP